MKDFFKPVRKTAAEKRQAKFSKSLSRSIARRFRRLPGKVPPKPVKASNCRTLALPKGVPLAETRIADRASKQKHVAAVRKQVFAASKVCAFCGESEAQSAQRMPIAAHQLHEWPSRALTRGLPLETRFSTVVCARVCADCHQLATNHVIWPVFADDALGWTGDYEVCHRDMRLLACKTAHGIEIVEPVRSW